VKPPSSAVEGLSEPLPLLQPACMKDPAFNASVIAGRLQSQHVQLRYLLILVSRLVLKRPGPERLKRANQILQRDTC
jgi:hypothetical protein